MTDQRRKNILPLARRLSLERLIALSGQYFAFPYYHSVSNHQLSHIKYLYQLRTMAEFKRDLEVFLRWYEPVALSDYLRDVEEHGGNDIKRKKGPEKKKRKMVLSFDDGLAECHSAAAPVLVRMGIPALFFLNNSFIDNRELFFRYKASILVDRVFSDGKAMKRAAEFLVIPEEQVVRAILMVRYKQRPLLDALAREVDVDYGEYMKTHPVYMSSSQIRELLRWGFEIGGHTRDHADFLQLNEEEMVAQVSQSVMDLRQRFGTATRFFALPFTSDGVPKRVVDRMLDERLVDAIFGTAGLKKTGHPRFIQRIPMEDSGWPALDILKAEYFYYLLKEVVGRNRYRY